MTKNETTNSKTTFIHGENGISIASMLEYLQLPNHPFHAAAIEQAAKFVAAEREEANARSRQMMRDQMGHISESEWSRIAD